MDNSRKKPLADNNDALAASGERRRIGRIVHDDRGNARVDWVNAPSDYKRPVLELEGEPKHGLSIQKPSRTFNPYECTPPPRAKKEGAPRKDLKKLSEWIKLMRELEERKSREETEGESEG
jgi:hypothetical protein